MERQPPVAPSDEIDLYVRTYTSLLRSTGEVRVRAFEESHAFSRSSLHEGALSPTPDVSAFAYAAARLPEEMPDVKLIVLGQSHELFEAAGYDVQRWSVVRTRGRRRPLRYDGAGTLAVFIASVSDIDDLVPIITAYQIEWNKMHRVLRGAGSLERVGPDAAARIAEAFGARAESALREVASRYMDLRVRMLAASFSQYQRAAQRWWSGVEPAYLRPDSAVRRPPVYFISSNTHAIANLLGGAAWAHEDAIVEYARRKNPEGLAERVTRAKDSGDPSALAPLLYYLLRDYIHESPAARAEAVRAIESQSGITHLSGPGRIDVDAQLIEVAKLDPARIDPRLKVEGIAHLKESGAIILNIDYPLGMAAYHLTSRLAQGVGELRGLYVMGKAATLNGRVGDVALSSAVYDEHTRNTFLFDNAFRSSDVAPWLRHGTVFDKQSALTVRSAFLQNKRYMSAFYKDGYTVLEMEAGPFLSAAYELVYPSRVPEDELVHLGDAPFEIGFVHYASDTPYSRRQSLLSKSLSFYGVDATYACAVAIVRRILERETDRARS